MQLLKPNALGVSYRAIEFRRRFGLCVSAYLYVPFEQGAAGAIWGEQAMWEFLGEEMSVPLIDEGVSKTTSEFLVHGYGYADPASPGAVATRARLGNREKTVLVFGDRYWDGAKPTAPRPFDRIPLDWSHAYGGPDYPQNPVGKGREEVDGIRQLPNLELPKSRVLAPNQPVTPASFAALGITSPQRSAFAGTYDGAWLKEQSPGFAPDTDWKFFNMAPGDQCLDGPLRGDEEFLLENMHPDKCLIEGKLPGLRVRLFARRNAAEPEEEGEAVLREVSTRLTTVWFFPHAERMVLVYHGLVESATDDADDIELLLAAVERLNDGEARSDDHYLKAIENRTNSVHSGIYSLIQSDLLPQGITHFSPESEDKLQALKPENLRGEAALLRARADVNMARAQARAAGQDPDALGIVIPERKSPPTLEELPGYLERVNKQMEAEQWRTVEEATTQLLLLRDKVATGDIDPDQLAQRGPPTLHAAGTLREIEQAHRHAGMPFDREKLSRQLEVAETAQKLQYLQSAHLQMPARAMEASQAASWRDDLEWMLSQGLRHWAGLDLTGADLSNLNLCGVDLSEAWLESVNLENSNLSGAKLNGAVLAHANLRRVVAVDADFSGANLGGANLEEVQFERSDFSAVTFMGTRFVRAEMRQCSVHAAGLLDTEWQNTDWSEAQGDGLLFYQLDLGNSCFSEGRFPDATFIECKLEKCDFRGASLGGMSLIQCDARAGLFTRAEMPGARFAQETLLQGAAFSEACLDRVNFGDANCTAASFLRAKMDGSCMTGATLAECDLRLCTAKDTLMRKTSLKRARLAGANAHGALLQRADLRGADLRHAHFFGADLSRVRLDNYVRLEGADLERARTYPRDTSANPQG